MIRLAILALAVALPLAACAPVHAATKTYSITDVSRLRIAGPFDVHVHVGPSVLGARDRAAGGDRPALGRAE